MQLMVLGLNHKTAPVEVRERLALSKEKIKGGFAALDEYPGLSELVVLSTCNRSEMYAVLEDDEDAGLLKGFWADIAGDAANHDQYMYVKTHYDCVRHLFTVASSLDSLVLGEGQILSQVKEAYAMAQEYGVTSTILNTLFHRAIATGKRVRTETRIAYNSVSVSYAAVELAAQALQGLAGRNALILGAGKMAELTAQHLKSHGIGMLYVANRHLDKATDLAQRFNGQAVHLGDAMSTGLTADVVVTSTGAPHYIVRSADMLKWMKLRQGRPVFIIDIAVPRDVEPEVGDIEGVTLYNIDALEAVVDEHVQERRAEASQAREIIEEEIKQLQEKFQYLSCQPLMASLSARSETIRQREVKRALAKLPDASEEELKVINNMSRMIVRKLLRLPMMEMYASAGTKNEKYYADAMRSLFRLDENISEAKSSGE